MALITLACITQISLQRCCHQCWLCPCWDPHGAAGSTDHMPHLLMACALLQVPYVQAPKLDTADEPEAVASGIKDKDVAARLAAAARRRRERLAQQRQQQEG